VDLIALAIPFFLVAIIVELTISLSTRRGFYRLNDSLNSLSAGMLDVTTGYFTKVLGLLAWGAILARFTVFELPTSAFDASASGLALWLAALIGWDFCYYWAHRAGHEITLFWAAHAVHHQSEEYNLSTALRQSSTTFLTSWLFYLPLIVLGFPVEILIAVNSINLIYQFWVHTQLVGKLGPLELFMVTPSNHRVHHAQNDIYIDRNYGGMFIVWDRLFGTFQEELDDVAPIYGVRRPLHSWNPVWANVKVYADVARDAWRTARWRDKIGIWFSRTGWRPNDVVSRWPAPIRPLETFEKYDPPQTALRRGYLALQLLAAIVATMAIALQSMAVEPRNLFLHCAMLWAGLVAVGWLNEGRPAGVPVECVRLLLLGWFADALTVNETVELVIKSYALSSLFGLALLYLYDKKQHVIGNNSIDTEVAR